MKLVINELKKMRRGLFKKFSSNINPHNLREKKLKINFRIRRSEFLGFISFRFNSVDKRKSINRRILSKMKV